MIMKIHKINGQRPYPPRVSAFTQVFWNELKRGCFKTTHCDSCDRQTFPPKVICPHCWSDKLSWKDLPTRGTLYTWTRIHAAPAVFQPLAPYTVGIVDLDGRIRLACPLIVPDGTTVNIGDKIEMAVMEFEDGPLFAASVAAAA